MGAVRPASKTPPSQPSPAGGGRSLADGAGKTVDKIFIDGVEVQTIVGVYDWEQKQSRPLILDLELGMDLKPSAASDALRDTVSYKAVTDFLIEWSAKQRFQLLEALAERMARRLFDEYPIQTLRLKMSKPGAVAAAKMVGIAIERRREDYAVCGM